MSRPTIADIAEVAGVSSTAVSFALNGRPGVAEPTRERIRKIADELGWTPNIAARALSTSRVNALGLIITAPYSELAHDAFFLRFIAGVEQALASSPVALVLKMVEDFEAELDAIRQWQGESRVDGLILVNPRPRDPRPALVNSLGIPAVFIGTPETPQHYSAVHIDDALAMHTLLSDLADHGAHSVTYLHTQDHFSHAQARLAALAQGHDPRIECTSQAAITGRDFDEEYEQIHTLLSPLAPAKLPDVLVCENEDLTLASLAALRDLNIGVPEQIGLVSWESTPGLTSRRPRVSTLERSPADMGVAAVELLRQSISEDNAFLKRELPCPRLHTRETLLARDVPSEAV